MSGRAGGRPRTGVTGDRTGGTGDRTSGLAGVRLVVDKIFGFWSEVLVLGVGFRVWGFGFGIRV